MNAILEPFGKHRGQESMAQEPDVALDDCIWLRGRFKSYQKWISQEKVIFLKRMQNASAKTDKYIYFFAFASFLFCMEYVAAPA